MRTELAIAGSTSPAVRYVGWAPVPAEVRLADSTGAAGPVPVVLRNRSAAGGGRVEFFSAVPGTAQAELAVMLPVAGTPVPVFLAGKWPRASTADGDTAVDVVDPATGQVLGSTQLMVRIRKDAQTLTTAERNAFRNAFAQFNNRGMGRFSDFRNVHTSAGDPEAHGRAGFLPWHRAFLLDLERELQAINPGVAMPYWRFDRPAPRVFTRAFMGVTGTATASVQFSADNPLQFWSTDGVSGVVRRPLFRTQDQGAFVQGELATLNRSDRYVGFRTMEGDPHGFAHTSFNGDISDIPTAAKDPLFFMLHANVDRLWAKWQWTRKRFTPTSSDTYSAQSTRPPRIGHNLDDTMWPWNEDANPPRPATAPGGKLASSALTGAPGPSPRVRDLIDYQGVVAPSNRLGFDYDDVPYQP